VKGSAVDFIVYGPGAFLQGTSPKTSQIRRRKSGNIARP
jgi:hypothetical protein